MSFPKAKLTRYYDEISCAPPPGKYDPKSEDKVKGAAFDKGARFNTPKLQPSSSMESLDSCCSSSSRTTPLFRTPSKIVGKKAALTSTPKILRSASKIPLPDKMQPKRITDPDQRLIEQINELTRVHQNQLMEKNEEVANLIEQINVLNNKIGNLVENQDCKKNKNEYETEINKLKKELIDLQAIISSNDENYKNQVDDLNSQISTLEENIANHITINRDLENSLLENSLIYEELNNKIRDMAVNFTVQLNKYTESISKVEDLNRCLFDDYFSILEVLKNESEDNLKNKETISELQDSINGCKDDLAQALKRCKMYEVVQNETSKTINVLSKRLRESELEVDHLNDIQQDLIIKKNRLEEQVKGLSVENQIIRDSLDTLQVSVKLEIETMQTQLVEKVEMYKQLAVEESRKQRLCIEEKQKTVEMLLGEIAFYKSKKMEDDFYISSCQGQITGYQDEITSLKKALADFELDFEEKIGAQKALFFQLSKEYESLKKLFNKEKETYEETLSKLNLDKSELENVCSDKEKRIVLLENDVKVMNDQLSQNQILIQQLEQHKHNSDKEINKLMLELEENKNNCPSLEEKSIIKNIEFEKIEQRLKEKEEIIQLLEYENMAQALTYEDYLEQKDELLKVIERQNREIEALSETADKHYSEKRKLEEENSKLQEEKELLKEVGKEDSMKVTSLEATIADLECRLRELNDIIGPFKNQLMQYESERNFLLSKSESTEKELRMLELEHAKSLGHQNHKQKIKHIVNLNQNIATLKKELEKYRLENIKLKHELTAKKPSALAISRNNKENQNKTQQRERNTSPASALKDRNG